MSTPPQPEQIEPIPDLVPGAASSKPLERQDQPARSMWRQVLLVFLQNKLAVVGLAIVVLFFLFCFLGPLIYHSNQILANLRIAELPPGSPGHPLGTDDVGYDELGRLMIGGQSALEIGLAAAAIATVFGSLWGAVAGYLGGFVDAIMMRVVVTFLAIPSLFLVLLLASIITPTEPLLILVIAFTAWLGPARLVRGETLSLRTRDYVQAVKMIGGGNRRSILRHILPNAIGTIVVNATFQVADAILILASLTFLGFGIAPPHADWGGMLSNGTQFTSDGYWWMIVWPGLCIVLIVVAFNFLGDALRDAFEVRLRKR
ncbi:MAG TPA: ABC transporter permease [Pseudonocardiaceae bacterium]|nr:ABC transporter permease [Pseudonocardiaceae bacterium]